MRVYPIRPSRESRARRGRGADRANSEVFP